VKWRRNKGLGEQPEGIRQQPARYAADRSDFRHRRNGMHVVPRTRRPGKENKITIKANPASTAG